MGKFAWIGAIAAIVMAVPAQSAPQSMPQSAQATDALIAETRAALDAGDALHAANLADAGLNNATLSASQHGRLFLYRGLAEELLGFRDPALKDFTAALVTSGLSAEERSQALLQRGFLRDGLGRLNEAAKDYSAVIALKGDSLATALNNRANIYRRQNRLADARRDYLAALSASGSKPQFAWYGLGEIAEAQTDMIAARRFYAKAVAADPGYALASERLEALGGPPEGTTASSQDQIVPKPPASAATAEPRAQTAKDGAVVLSKPQSAMPPASAPAPSRGARERLASAMSASRDDQTKAILRPALDQAGARVHGSAGSETGASEPDGIELQLGAWRSEGEANAGWNDAKLRAGGDLDGFSPHIMAADLPGKGRYYRLRISVGRDRSALCAKLSAKGVACLPARD